MENRTTPAVLARVTGNAGMRAAGSGLFLAEAPKKGEYTLYSMAIILGALGVLVDCSAHAVYGVSPIDVCALLTPGQVSAELGVTVGAGQKQGEFDCQWSQPGRGLSGKAAFLHVLGTVGHLTPVDQFNNTKAPLPIRGITKTPLSGVGDDAVYVTTGAQTGLTVKKGNSVFQIRIHGFPLDQTKAREKALAQEVLAKL